jgi:serine/threonine protein kinase
MDLIGGFMKQDIKDISYNISKSEELKLKKEKEKQLLNDFKQDIRYTLLALIQEYYERNGKLYDIINNKDEICRRVESYIADIKESVEIEIIDKNSFSTKKQKVLKSKYRDYSEFMIYDEIEKQFLSQYKYFKQLTTEENKLAEETAIDITYKDLCEYYDYLHKQGYTKTPILKVLEKNKQVIIRDLKDTNKGLDFTDTIYKKALAKVKEHYFDEPPKTENVKMPLGWKLFFGLKVLESLKKHL